MPRKSEEQKSFENNVAKRITEYRKYRRKESQKAFAETVGISYDVIRQRESHDTAYNCYDIVRIADKCEVDVEYLLDRQDVPSMETRDIKSLTALTERASDILRDNATHGNWFNVALHSWIIEQLDDDILNDLYALIYLDEYTDYAKIRGREEEIIFNSKDLIRYKINDKLNRLLHGFENTFRTYYEEQGYQEKVQEDLYNSFDDEIIRERITKKIDESEG